MKFLHTSDWQIGMKFVHLGNTGETVRKHRTRTARHLMALAAAEKVDFILVAGDTFEDNAIDRGTVRSIAGILGGVDTAVYVIPGNHDPAIPGAVWEDPAWQEHPNVRLLLEQKPVDIPGGRLYPCPLVSKHSSADPTAWIPAETGHGIRIALAHGTANGWLPQEHNHEYPIATDLPEKKHLDYVALGHIHSTKLFDSPGPTRMAYCGTHEPTAFGEGDSGNALIVEIDGPGAVPRITKIRTGALTWIQIDRTVGGVADFEAVYEELHRLPAPEDKLVECRIAGFLADGAEEIEQRIRTLLDVFLFGRYETNLKVDYRDSEWIAQLPAGYVQTAAKALAARAGEAPGDAVASRAIQLLGRIWQEVRP